MAQIEEKNNENSADFASSDRSRPVATDSANQATNGEIKKLLAENLELTRKIYSLVRKIKGQMFWQRLFFGLKILIFVALLALSFIYLPPLLNNAVAPYKELLNINAGGLNADSVGQIINQLKKQ